MAPVFINRWAAGGLYIQVKYNIIYMGILFPIYYTSFIDRWFALAGGLYIHVKYTIIHMGTYGTSLYI